MNPWAAILVGVGMLAAGIHVYVDPRAMNFWSMASMRRPVIYALIPCGLGLVLFGVGLMVPVKSISDFLVVSILPLWFVGVVLMFWHPSWVRPHWLRDSSLGD